MSLINVVTLVGIPLIVLYPVSSGHRRLSGPGECPVLPTLFPLISFCTLFSLSSLFVTPKVFSVFRSGVVGHPSLNPFIYRIGVRCGQ